MNGSSASPMQPARRLDRVNAAQQVMDDLKNQILSGQISRGTKLRTEKQLAEDYGVSGPTIREAIRGLSTACLVEVRHGSGAFVTADADQLIGVSLGSMIQLRQVSVSQVLGVLAALNAYAAELAATNATSDDLAVMRETLKKVEQGTSSEEILGEMGKFMGTLAHSSGNPLLETLCNFLTSLHFGLAVDLSKGEPFETPQKTAGRLTKVRRRLLDAIAAKDVEGARSAARDYHARALKIITALPRADTTLISDPALSKALTSLLQRNDRGDAIRQSADITSELSIADASQISH